MQKLTLEALIFKKDDYKGYNPYKDYRGFIVNKLNMPQ